MPRVLILGADGMLGSMLTAVIGGAESTTVTPVSRAADGFDARSADLDRLLRECDCDWVVNAIGILRGRIDESDPASVAEAFAVNAEFPQRLAAAAAPGQRIVQIGTDAVFAGAAGPHDEADAVDPLDAYGQSKAAGEVSAPQVLNLRCSIVGRTPGRPSSLLDWVLDQPRGATISGYTDQLWNGLTTLHLARLIAAAIAEPPPDLPPVLHLVPADALSKADLLELALTRFGRDDVTVERGPGPAPSDTRLTTSFGELNRQLWHGAGYDRAPTIAKMIAELAADGDG